MTQAQTPTSAADLVRINALFKDLQTTMVNLASRWMDESQYEDINDYRKVIEAKLPAGFVIVKMTKRPFGFHFNIGTSATYKMFCSGRRYSWSRV